MPFPYPEVFADRGVRPGHSALADRVGLNMIVLVLSFLHCGGHPVAPASICCGARPSPRQWEALLPFQQGLLAWNEFPEVTAEDMGRSAAKVEGIAGTLQDLLEQLTPAPAALRSYRGLASSGPPKPGSCGHPGVVVGSASADAPPLAKKLESSRLSFHGRPSFDPVPFLDASNRDWYPAHCYAQGVVPPRVRFHCAKGGAYAVPPVVGSERSPRPSSAFCVAAWIRGRCLCYT